MIWNHKILELEGMSKSSHLQMRKAGFAVSNTHQLSYRPLGSKAGFEPKSKLEFPFPVKTFASKKIVKTFSFHNLTGCQKSKTITLQDAALNAFSFIFVGT